MGIDLKSTSELINNIILKGSKFLLFIFILLFFLNLYDVSFVKKRYLCYSSECFSEFFLLYDHVFKVLTVGVACTTVLLGWLTVQIYLKTYLTTHTNNLNTQIVNQYSTYLKHYDFFNALVDRYIIENKYILSKDIDKFVMYNFIFSSPSEGNFNISEDYKLLIKKMNKNIEILNNNLPRKLGYIDHRDTLILNLEKVGVKIPKCDRRDFLKLEIEAYFFINNINKNINMQQLITANYNAYG